MDCQIERGLSGSTHESIALNGRLGLNEGDVLRIGIAPDEEYATKRGWGHSTTSDAAISAVNSETKRLALFHHDPMHDDQKIDSMVEFCRNKIKENGKEIRVMGAADKLTLRI